jgi:hypothetical protein
MPVTIAVFLFPYAEQHKMQAQEKQLNALELLCHAYDSTLILKKTWVNMFL